jgi:dihydrofolate synthase/folylpolyglutamate synthase
LVDAAHNPHGATALATSLESEFTFDVLVGVVGMFADKDSEGFLGVMEPTFDRLLITQTDHERALAAGELAEIAIKIYGDDRVEVLPRLTDAIARGIEIADAVLAEDDKNVGIVVCGSVYTAAQARALLGKRDV